MRYTGYLRSEVRVLQLPNTSTGKIVESLRSDSLNIRCNEGMSIKGGSRSRDIQDANKMGVTGSSCKIIFQTMIVEMKLI